MTEEIIIDGMDILNCEQAKSCDCCRCKNMAYYRLEQENKKLREWLDRAESGERDEIDINNNYRSVLEEIKELVEKSIKISYNLEVDLMLYDIIHKINEVLK